ncbi:MAG: hypothetical protein AAF611_10995 [Bacteroidota bacterium]
MDLKNDLDLLVLKLKRYKINIVKEKGRVSIKSAAFDSQQFLIYCILPLIFGTCVVVGVTIFFIFSASYLIKSRIVAGIYILGYLSGFALLGFAYASFLRIKKKKKENNTAKILFKNKLIFKVDAREVTYDATNINTIKNTIEIHGDNILMGNVFLVDAEENEVTIVSLEGYKSNHLRSDLVWLENFFKSYLKLEE